MTRRRVIFPPADYWTNKENNTVTDTDRPTPRDIRLAAALTIHHRSGNTAGVHEIVRQVAEDDRASALLMSLLDLHRVFVVQTRTAIGVDYMATYVQGIGSVKPTDDSSMDIHLACRILDGHGRDDFDGINDALRTARAQGRCTQVLLALLDLFTAAIPELSSTAGKTWLDACVAAVIGGEA